nr:MAG: hypothetical protein [Bacteriophage sp.]
MNKYYMKKFNKFADFIIECLVEEYTKLEFTNYKLKEEYNRVTIQLYIKINSNEYEIRIPCDFNVPISKILHEAKSDISQIILNCYK